MKKIIIVAVLVFGLVLAGCGAKDSGASSQGKSDNDYGDAFSAFTNTDINGEETNQKVVLKNKLTLVEVWGTYCSACISSMPDSQALYEKYKDKKFGIVGLVVDAKDHEGKNDSAKMEEAVAITKDKGVTYPNLLVPMEANGILSDIQAIPSFFFVDNKGKVVSEIYTGAKSIDEWSKIIDEKMGL